VMALMPFGHVSNFHLFLTDGHAGARAGSDNR